VHPAQEWRVPIGTIYIRTPNGYWDGDVIYGDTAPPQWDDTPVRCPQCGCEGPLEVSGHWEDPATIQCPAGHTWQDGNTDWGIRKEAISQASPPG
jgi:hypothetical protein